MPREKRRCTVLLEIVLLVAIVLTVSCVAVLVKH